MGQADELLVVLNYVFDVFCLLISISESILCIFDERLFKIIRFDFSFW